MYGLAGLVDNGTMTKTHRNYAPTWPPPPGVRLDAHLGDRLRASVAQFALGREAQRAGYAASEITLYSIRASARN